MRALGSRIHSYPAEQGVPDQDASCEANRLKAAGPIFGDGSKPRRAPLTRLPRSPGVPLIGHLLSSGVLVQGMVTVWPGSRGSCFCP